MTHLELIQKERERQIFELGHTTQKDLLYKKDELISAAIAYMKGDPSRCSFNINVKDRKTNLIKAAALILAELDRMEKQDEHKFRYGAIWVYNANNIRYSIICKSTLVTNMQELVSYKSEMESSNIYTKPLIDFLEDFRFIS